MFETTSDGRANDGRGESPLQRADRNMVELLQELRVAQTIYFVLLALMVAFMLPTRTNGR